MGETGPTAARVGPWRLFFPSALLLAPINVLLWLAVRDGLIAPAGIDSAAWHGGEMLFGYSFAVIAGFLLQPMRWPALLLLWLAWLAGRLLWLVPALPVLAELAVAGGFPVVLAVLGARRFAAVRRARNLPFPLILITLGLGALGAAAAQLGLLPHPKRSPTVLAVYLVMLLVALMGGRLVPTATVGALREQGIIVRIPPRPLLELSILVAILGLAIADGFLAPWAAGGTALAVAALLIAQMRDWRGIRTASDSDLWPLHAGFVWLALGCALVGLERLGIVALPDAGALHALAAGGIGTVTLVMMLRVTRHRAGGLVTAPALLHGLHSTLALAVALRVAGGWALPDHRGLMLWLSAAAWLIAYGLAAALVLPAARRAPV